MDGEAVPLTAFRWRKPDPSTGTPSWVHAESLVLDGAGLFPLFQRERRWLSWESVPRQLPYNPLDECPELWLDFISRPEGEEEFTRFAITYGGLTRGVITTHEFAEAYGRWVLAHRNLRTVWAVYEAARGNRISTLSRWIALNDKVAQFVGQPVDGFAPRWGRAISVKELDSIDGLWSYCVEGTRSPSERLRRLAMSFVARRVNHFMLAPVPGDDESLAGDDVTARLIPEMTGGGHVVRFAPSSLLAAMWLQLAQTVEGDLQYRQCSHAGCRRWFLLSPIGAGRRRHSLFCTARCRLREWRTVQRKAPSRSARHMEKRDAKTRTR